MTSTIQPRTIIPSILIALTLLCPAAPNAFGVVPAPDGGYSGFTTAEGQNALLSLTSGIGNTAVGWFSLKSLTMGSLNTATGAGTLVLNTADNNTATGAGALLSNTTGPANTANGAFALLSNTTGAGNTASGYQALFLNQDGANNAAYGYIALYNNTGSFNTALGSQTLVYNTAGANNTAAGYQALAFNTNGDYNTANGYHALFSNTTGDGNTAIGNGALNSNTSGGNNIALGNGAGIFTTGDDNIDIGNLGVAGESGIMRIGSNVTTTATYIVGIAGQTVGAGGTTCYVDNDGKLGVFLSARRFKTDIADMGAASDAVLALRPVTFHYKPELDKTGIPQFGLVAEEVAEVNPDLVTHDAKGDICTVRYEAVNVMLLNEFLKEHKTVQELKSALRKQEAIIAQLNDDRANHEATISNLGKVLNAVLARLNEQDSKIQMVNDRLELSEPVTQLAVKKR